MVEEDKFTDVKGLRWLMVRLALFIIGLAVSIGTLVSTMMGSGFALIMLVLLIVAFSQITEIMTEDAVIFAKFNKLSKFWFTGYILYVVIFLILKFLNFK